jgi:PAS domain S-box-containing protein
MSKSLPSESGAPSEVNKFALIAEKTIDAVVITNAEQTIEWINDSFTRITGYTLAEVQGKNFLDLLQSPQVDPLTVSLMRDNFKQQQPFNCEILNYSKQGHAYWLEVEVQPLHNIQGQLTHFICIETDVTRRKFDEERIKDSEAKLRAILHSAVEAVITTDQQGLVQDFNPAAEAIFGYQFDEVVGKNVNLFMPMLYSQQRERLIWGLNQNSEHEFVGKTLEIVAKSKTGRIFPIEVCISRVELHEGVLYTSMIRDISERKKAEVALRESEERFRNLADAAPVFIWMTNTQHEYIYFNEAWLAHTGKEMPELIGSGWISDVHPDDRHICLEQYFNAAEVQQSFQREFRLYNQEGHYRWLLDEGVPRFSVSGEFLGYIGASTDISEKVHAQEMRNEFVATVSHELRTPITSIRGSLNLLHAMLDKAEGVTAKASQLLEIAVSNCDRLVAIVNDILDIEKIEAGKMDYHFATVSLHQLLKQAVEANMAYAQQFSVKLALTSSEKELKIEADESRMMQVLTNLISNAVKFSPKQATVKIYAEPLADKVKVVVEDSGPGIPKAFQPRIFEKFSQAQQASKQRVPGTGLGLSICQAIVEAHHGEIGFTSSEQGTLFYFILPLIPH